MPKTASKKEAVRFFCSACGNEFARWEGRCRACGEWNTLTEAPQEPKARRAKGGGGAGGAARLTARRPARALAAYAGERVPRLAVPIGEFHRVLGGGAVPGGSALVGGEPGIGKSTLLLQILGALAAEDGRRGAETSKNGGEARPLLYITGEEAPSQIAERGLRLGQLAEGKVRYAFGAEHLMLAGETELPAVLELLDEHQPAVCVVDSIQTLRDPDLPSAPGAVNQVRECAMALVDAARRLNAALFLIGHVTKDGTLAGPRVLEHVVDTVLSFEGENRLGLRVLRVLKNRFGPADEVGLFEMTGGGLEEVADPSAVLLDREGASEKGPGSAVGALSEGSRVLLVELQALTVPVPGGGSPSRRASGLDPRRLAMLLAVLETKAGIPFRSLDVFASAAGGFRIDEPAADLPLALALASVATDRPVREGLLAVGEVGLNGELRPVPRLEARVSEAKRLGFQAMLVPARGKSNVAGQSIKLLKARTVREALAMGLA